MTEEVWRVVPKTNGVYEVSNLGNVRSWSPAKLGSLLNPAPNSKGCPIVKIAGKSTYVHKLVATAFIGPCPEGQMVRHWDGNPSNNHASNLRYGTHADNMADSVRHGTHNQVSKKRCPQGHPYDEANTYHYRGRRYCRTCKKSRKGG